MNRLILLLLLASQNFFAQEWRTDLDQAFEEAAASNRNILLFFSVSDACDICRRLDHDIFQSQEFSEYAHDNLILVKLDFKNQAGAGKSDQLLIVEKYNKDGFFPWVVIVNKNQKVIGKLPLYDTQTPRQYVAQIKLANQ